MAATPSGLGLEYLRGVRSGRQFIVPPSAAGALDLRRVVKEAVLLWCRRLEGLLPRLTQAAEACGWMPYPSMVSLKRIFPVAGRHGRGETDATEELNLQSAPLSGVNGRSLTRAVRVHDFGGYSSALGLFKGKA